jgi:hypothetical protein
MTERQPLTGADASFHTPASGRNPHHSPRSSWTEKLFDNLLPHSDEVEEETVEKLTRAYQTRKDLTDKASSLTPLPTFSSPAFSHKSNSPKVRGDGKKKYNMQDLPPRGPVCRMGAALGPLESIQSSESNTPTRSGSITPLSSSNDISSIQSRSIDMRPSIEAETMDRLLHLVNDGDHDHDDYDHRIDKTGTNCDAVMNQKQGTGTLLSPYGQSGSISSSSSAQPGSTKASVGKNRVSSKSTAAVISDTTYWKEKKFIQRYINELKSERTAMKDAWKAEFEEERRRSSLSSSISGSVRKFTNGCLGPLWEYLSYAEVFISNMPLTIGAVGLSWVTQGSVWFKCMEEFVDACIPTHYFAPQCMYYEFPR